MIDDMPCQYAIAMAELPHRWTSQWAAWRSYPTTRETVGRPWALCDRNRPMHRRRTAPKFPIDLAWHRASVAPTRGPCLRRPPSAPIYCSSLRLGTRLRYHAHAPLAPSPQQTLAPAPRRPRLSPSPLLPASRALAPSDQDPASTLEPGNLRPVVQKKREGEVIGVQQCRSGMVPRSTRTATRGSRTSAGRSTRQSPVAGSVLFRRSPASASAAGTKSTGSADTASTSPSLSLQSARSAGREPSGRRTITSAEIAPRISAYVPSAALVSMSLLERM